MIPYDLTKIKALIFDVDGVLSAGTISMTADGDPLRTVNIKDGYAIQLAVKMGITVAIITGGNTENVRRRYEKLGVRHIFMGASVKIQVYEELRKAENLMDDEVLYMGDDIPDYEIMQQVGCPVCPHDACQEVRDISLYVSPCDGGYGCVRDVIEQVLRAKGLWMSSAKAFGW